MVSTSVNQVPCSDIRAPIILSYFTCILSGVLCFGTVIGNMLICIAVYKDPQKKFRSPYMFIIVNLSVTDLIVGIITLPISVITHALEITNQKKDSHVTTSRIFYFVTVTASTLNLIAFCVDRYVAVNMPIKYRRIMNFRICIVLVTSIWIFSIAISCLYILVGYIDFIVVFAQISFCLVIVMCIITFRLLRLLKHSSRLRRRLTSIDINENKSKRKPEHGVTILFLTFLITFLVCNTPAIVMMYFIKFCPHCGCVSRHWIRDLSFLFIVSNSALNPFFCTIRLKPFHVALLTIFYPRRPKNQRTVSRLSTFNDASKSIGNNLELIEKRKASSTPASPHISPASPHISPASPHISPASPHISHHSNGLNQKKYKKAEEKKHLTVKYRIENKRDDIA